MARIRTVKPSIWTDERFIRLSRDARLLCIGMISHADDEGRLLATATRLAGDIFPADDLKPAQVLRWRAEVERTGMVRIYTVGGVEYAVFPRWKKHQRISKPQPSTLPGPEQARNDSTPKRGTVPRPGVSLARGGAHVKETGEEEEGKGPPPQTPPPPHPPPTAGARDEGEGDQDQQDEGQRLAALVGEVKTLRPEWSERSIRRALTQPAVVERPLGIVRSAILAVAQDPSSQQPGRLEYDGPWWRLPAPPKPAGPPPVDPLAAFDEAPRPDPARAARGRAEYERLRRQRAEPPPPGGDP